MRADMRTEVVYAPPDEHAVGVQEQSNAEAAAAMSLKLTPGVSPTSARVALPRPRSDQTLSSGITAHLVAAEAASVPLQGSDGSVHMRRAAQGPWYGPGSHPVDPARKARSLSPVGYREGAPREYVARGVAGQTLAAEVQPVSASTSSEAAWRFAPGSGNSSGGALGPSPLRPSPLQGPAGGGGSGSAMLMRALYHQTTNLGTFAESDAWRTVSMAVGPPQAPGFGASLREQLTFMEQQLDSFGPRGKILDGRYEMLGDEQRCRGGELFQLSPRLSCAPFSSVPPGPAFLECRYSVSRVASVCGRSANLPILRSRTHSTSEATWTRRETVSICSVPRCPCMLRTSTCMHMRMQTALKTSGAAASNTLAGSSRRRRMPPPHRTRVPELSCVCALGRGVRLPRHIDMTQHLLERVAGQALVQFVRSLQTHQQYAVKLFASRSAFEDEKGMYLRCCRGLFMPAVLEFVDNEDGSFRDPSGNPMPPCFVMEKGESLTERTTRCHNDLVTIVQVRAVAAARCTPL